MLKKQILHKISSNKRQSITIVVIALLISVLLFSDYGIISRISLENELHNNENKIAIEKQTEDSLKKIINSLQTDSLEIEKIARENYGMVKPNEEVFHVKKEKRILNKN